MPGPTRQADPLQPSAPHARRRAARTLFAVIGFVAGIVSVVIALRVLRLL